MSSSSENKFQLSFRAKAKGFKLRVRLRGALHTSPILCARRLSGSVSARARGFIVYLHLTLLQVLGAYSYGSPAQSSTAVRYSLRIRVRKLLLRIRGKHRQAADHGNHPILKAATKSSAPPSKKPHPSPAKNLVYRFLPRKMSFKKKTVPQEEQQASGMGGYLAPYTDALRTDRAVMVMQAVGVASTLTVLVQLAGAGGLPLLAIFLTGLAVAGRLVVMNSGGVISPGVRQLWQQATAVGGVSLLPQAMRVMLGMYVPRSGLVETIVAGFVLIIILLARYGRLPVELLRWFGVLSPWTTAILFLWAPFVQLWTSFWNPALYNNRSVFAGLLSILSNSVQIQFSRPL